MNVRATIFRHFHTLLIVAAFCPVPFVAQAENDLRRDATVRAIEQVMPSVVNIRTENVVEYRDPFEQFFREFFAPYHQRQRNHFSLGSGVIIHESGYVLTNLHVLRRASRVWVVLWDGRTYEAEARYFGMARSDMAIIKLKTPPGEAFQAIRFAPENDVLLGETVLALGNPFGLGGSVSRGIISSKRRIAPGEHEELGVANWLQTDAPINPGNSGGPLVNLDGDLVGLNVAMLREAQGIGFAIPMEQVNEALSEIFAPEIFSARWLGARVRREDLVVASVQPDSPAGKAGLRPGDAIIQVNGQPPGDLVEWTGLLGEESPLEFTLLVGRDGERLVFSGEMISFQALIRERLGLDVQELTPELAAGFGLAPQAGLLIAGTEKDGPGERANLQPGFVVNRINGERVTNLLSAATHLMGGQSGGTVRLGLLVPQYRGETLAAYLPGTVTLRMQ